MRNGTQSWIGSGTLLSNHEEMVDSFLRSRAPKYKREEALNIVATECRPFLEKFLAEK